MAKQPHENSSSGRKIAVSDCDDTHSCYEAEIDGVVFPPKPATGTKVNANFSASAILVASVLTSFRVDSKGGRRLSLQRGRGNRARKSG